uniref:hypothetical protein n=1 Tax=uncultured Legionella sp. TaxID=210934 RepID=UPI0026206B08
EALICIFIYWQEAFINYLNGNYIAHDALVGENACHIRAFALLDIAQLTNNEHFHTTLITIIAEIKYIINTIDALTLTTEDTKKSVKNFLIEHGLIFFIPNEFAEQLKYLIDSYLLTLTKEQLHTSGLTLKERTSYEAVRNWGFAYNRAQYLVHHTQKSLSAMSCEYVISQAKLLKNNDMSLLLHIKKDAHERSFIPQFFTAKVLFLRALEKNTILLIKITRYFNLTPLDTTVLCFKPNASNNDFELCSNFQDDKPCVMIEGVIDYKDIPETMAEYKSRFISQSILDTILANFAIHPQYSGELKHLPPPFEEALLTLNNSDEVENIRINTVLTAQEEFYRNRQYAIDNGCSLENPGLLFINHMYCDNTANYTEHFDDNNLRANNELNISELVMQGSQKLTLC